MSETMDGGSQWNPKNPEELEIFKTGSMVLLPYLHSEVKVLSFSQETNKYKVEKNNGEILEVSREAFFEEEEEEEEPEE